MASNQLLFSLVLPERDSTSASRQRQHNVWKPTSLTDARSSRRATDRVESTSCSRQTSTFVKKTAAIRRHVTHTASGRSMWNSRNMCDICSAAARAAADASIIRTCRPINADGRLGYCSWLRLPIVRSLRGKPPTRRVVGFCRRERSCVVQWSNYRSEGAERRRR